MKNYLRLIDTHTTGRRYDVTPVFTNAEAFRSLVTDLLSPFDPLQIDTVAGIDALGYVLGAAAALQLGKGFLTIRKGGKLPVESDKQDFVDYSGERKSLELRPGALLPGTRVLLVDEWIETGALVAAAIRLIERQGATVVGITTIHMDINEKTRSLLKKINAIRFG